MAKAGDLEGECSDGVCVSNEEVLRCVCTAGETDLGVEKMAGAAML